MLTRRALLRMAGAGLATGTLAVACASPTPSPTAAATPPAASVTPTASPARPIATVSVYSALADAATDALVAGFRAAHPAIAVDVLSRAPIAELRTRIRVERDAVKADVLVGGDSAFHASLAREGLVAGGAWSGWYAGVLGFAATGGRRIGSWDDLLADEWKKRIVLPDPSKTAAGYVFLATQVFRLGHDEDAAIAFVKTLDRNVDRYTGRTAQALDLLASGDAAGAPAWAHEAAGRAGIELSLPDPTGTELGAIGLLAGGPQPAAAKVLVDWLLAKDGAETLVRSMKVTSTRTDVAAPGGVATPASARLVAYDRAWAEAGWERLVDKWLTALGR